MIHFTCDGCQRPIDTQDEVRYVVRMEVYAALDTSDQDCDSDRDHLQEIDDILEALDDLESDEVSGEIFQQVRYDLCADCRKKFLSNPLSRATMRNIGFSNN